LQIASIVFEFLRIWGAEPKFVESSQSEIPKFRNINIGRGRNFIVLRLFDFLHAFIIEFRKGRSLKESAVVAVFGS
jgi:hypothetical protein